MRTIHAIFDDEEYFKLNKKKIELSEFEKKKKLSWHDFILFLLKTESGRKNKK